VRQILHESRLTGKGVKWVGGTGRNCICKNENTKILFSLFIMETMRMTDDGEGSFGSSRKVERVYTDGGKPDTNTMRWADRCGMFLQETVLK
jgi:hypothetical protein